MLAKVTRVLELFKKIKLSTIIILIILLMFNSYAWFIYATKVSGGFTAHVTSWNVTFSVGSDESVTNIDIDVERMYPGMQTYVKEIEVHNSGEMTANLLYSIEQARIFANEFSVGEDVTSQDLEDMLMENYPFDFNITVDTTNFYQENGVGYFRITVSWPFESGNDNLDTIWGQTAYNYSQVYPENSSLYLRIKLSAEQRT